MRKIFGYKFKKVNGLVRPECEEMSEVRKIKFTDRGIGNVTYRVWLAFKDEVNTVDSLENLMLNKLESDDIEEQPEQDNECECGEPDEQIEQKDQENQDKQEEQEEQESPTLNTNPILKY